MTENDVSYCIRIGMSQAKGSEEEEELFYTNNKLQEILPLCLYNHIIL